MLHRRTHGNHFFHYFVSALLLATCMTLCCAIPHTKAATPASTSASTPASTSASTSAPTSAENLSKEPQSVTLSLQEHGTVQEEIILHVDIPQDVMPANAWGRVAIKSTITLEDGTVQKGNVEVLEGVPETTMHFPQQGLYELTISVGYLVKST